MLGKHSPGLRILLIIPGMTIRTISHLSPATCSLLRQSMSQMLGKHSPGFRILLIIPGMTIRNIGVNFNQLDNTNPPCPWARFLVANDRCTMSCIGTKQMSKNLQQREMTQYQSMCYICYDQGARHHFGLLPIYLWAVQSKNAVCANIKHSRYFH